MNKLFKVTVEYGLDEDYGGDAHSYRKRRKTPFFRYGDIRRIG